MSRKLLETMPEVFVATTEASTRNSRLRREGHLRTIAPRLYTPNLTDRPEDIIQRHLWPIVSQLVPNAVVSHRTAIELKPSDGTLFVTAEREGRFDLPGLTIRRLKGPGPLEGDTPYIGGLHLASRARAVLENLQPSRTRLKVSKSIGKRNVEERLARLALQDPRNGLNKLRDDARRIAPALGASEEFEILDDMIGALQRTRDAGLSAPGAIALRDGRGFDPKRIDLFSALHAVLHQAGPVSDRPSAVTDNRAFKNVAFFDAYFSNYIEGTQFEVGEAIGIVFGGVLPERRPADAHDVLGTFQVVGSFDNMTRKVKTFEEFICLLRDRHRTILAGRPETKPGDFKEAPNQVGTTVFVAPHLVEGTLRQGWDLLSSLDHPFTRALFTMFVIAEVHPFDDGNGRIARAMMNAELVSGDQCRIFIPSVYRNEYIGALRLLTNHRDPAAFIKVMDFAQDFVSKIDFADLDAAQAVLTNCNAFKDPTDAERLLLPGPAVHS